LQGRFAKPICRAAANSARAFHPDERI